VYEEEGQQPISNHVLKKGGGRMKEKVLFVLSAFMVFVSLSLGGETLAGERTIDPIVSTDWLEANTGLENLVIIDVRTALEYGQDHIPGSISAPFLTNPPEAAPNTGWVTFGEGGLLLELPQTKALLEYIGSLGITTHSKVVTVTSQAPPPTPAEYGLASATRVADTLVYAGVKNVAILDGGYPKWKGEGKPVTAKVPDVKPVTYQGTTDKSIFVSREYVRGHIGKSVIIDARDAIVYFGVVLEPFADKAGHIQSAKCLPAPWIWNKNSDGKATYYTYRDPKLLGAMAAGIAGKPGTQESMVYCGVGGYASSWWFVLTQVLGYKDVKLYDGSAQEWAKHYDMVPFQWD
jgi:thiosulfate/3-mercaptopyruvate sulfurtransferase